MIIFVYRIQIVKDHCLQFIIKEENFNDIIMSNEFSDLDKSLLVEIIRKRLNPSKIVNEISMEKNVGKLINYNWHDLYLNINISILIKDYIILYRNYTGK